MTQTFGGTKAQDVSQMTRTSMAAQAPGNSQMTRMVGVLPVQGINQVATQAPDISQMTSSLGVLQTRDCSWKIHR